MKKNKSISIDKLKKELKSAQKEINLLKTMVEKDELTGLYNRRGFIGEISRYIEDIKKENLLSKKHITRKFSVRNVGILFIDVNDFKKINDKYGHDVGDTVLKNVADILLDSVRDIDVVARWSGDEFVVGLMANDISDFEITKSRINRKLKKYKIRGKKYSMPTLSIGISAVYNEERSKKYIFNIKKLIELADKMMYEEKNNNKTNKKYK